jgi:hypothetical protein
MESVKKRVLGGKVELQGHQKNPRTDRCSQKNEENKSNTEEATKKKTVSSSSTLSPSECAKLRVVDLTKELKARGLPTKGLKVKRL